MSDDDADLLKRCHDRGYTPGARDVSSLVARWIELSTPGSHAAPPDERRAAAGEILTALARGDLGVARRLEQTFATQPGLARALCLAALTRIAQRIDLPNLPACVLAALTDDEPRVVREAARGAGKLRGVDLSSAESALLSALEHSALPEQRAIVEALGRVGGEASHAVLEPFETDDDDLRRRVARTLALIERRSGRVVAGSITLDQSLAQPVRVRLRCRRGAAAVVFDQVTKQLQGHGTPEVTHRDSESVSVQWSGTLRELYEVRSALDVALVFPLPSGPTLSERVVAGLLAPALIDAVSSYTEGVPRFRLAFAQGGHRRAVVWDVVTKLAEQKAPLDNDSRQASWTVEVDESGAGTLLCVPKHADPRFAYRHADVPAASHPTLAALLAWVAQPRAGELVWDPFCGSASELVECARLCPELVLCGTDTDPAAITAARRNIAAANVVATAVHLHQGDARSTRPGDGRRRPSLIVCNPPMGRRVAHEGHVRDLLVALVQRAGRALERGGRLVWLSPSPRLTHQAGVDAGLSVHDHDEIDMGGFWATLQVMRQVR